MANGAFESTEGLCSARGLRQVIPARNSTERKMPLADGQASAWQPQRAGLARASGSGGHSGTGHEEGPDGRRCCGIGQQLKNCIAPCHKLINLRPV